MPSTSSAYRSAVRVATAAAPLIGLFNPKLRNGIRARQQAGDRLLEWARWNRDTSRPLVWFHGASVGEGRQAESVLHALRRLRPDCQTIYTHFSPSAESLASSIGAEAWDYLPYDFPGHVDRLLQVLQPDLLVFAKLDVWPELSTRAATTGVDVALIAGTVSPGSSRLRWPARALLEPGYRALTAAAAIARPDADRLAALGVERERISVLGDPRFDSVAGRVSQVAPDDPLLALGRHAGTLVAGSTWPGDETVLLQAFSGVLAERLNARLILVPHEPTSAHLEQLERSMDALGLPAAARLSQMISPTPIVLVDRVGVLAALYGAGIAAYVGGGFGRAGLHSVLEPAAWGIPVTFGPRWQNSRDAELLLEAEAAIPLPPRRQAAEEALRRQWCYWISNEEARLRQGSRAREVVEQGLGAAERNAALLADLISARRPRR